MVEVKIKKLHKDAVIPSYANDGDACFDLTCVDMEPKDNFIQYNTGLAFEIPKGYVGLIYPRSSVTKKDMMLKNSVGVIDSGYRGEVSFRFLKTKTPTSNGILGPGGRTHNIPEVYEVGERIGQMMIIPIPQITLTEVDELSDSERGTGGYGSSGK